MKYIRVFRKFFWMVALVCLLTSCAAQPAYRHRVQKNKGVFRKMAEHVLTTYNDGKFTNYIIIVLDTVTDTRLREFCEMYDIKNIYIHNDLKAQSQYNSNTISFFKNYTPLVGKKTEIIIDYQTDEQRGSNPFPKGFTRLDDSVYYARY